MRLTTHLQPIAEAPKVPQESKPLTLLELLEDLDPSSDEDELQASVSTTPESHDLPEPTPSSPIRSSPPSPPSPTPSFEMVALQGGKDIPPPPLHLALGLWFEKSGGSRADYVRLREVFQLSKKPVATGSSMDDGEGNGDIQTLPFKLDSLKRQIRRHIPLLQLSRKPLAVIIEKQPSLPQREKGQRQIIERQAWQYWYEPLDLIRTILSATFLREKMFFGMAQYVDEPTELWQSHAWGSSIRSTSGEVCHTQRGALIIPGDIVKIRSAAAYRIGRVTFIGRDYREGAAGDIIITLQAVADRRQRSVLDNFNLDVNDKHEFFLLEDVLLEETPQSIIRHLNIYCDRDFGWDEEEKEEVYPDERFFIRRVLNLKSSTVRALRQLHPTRGELEVAYFGREHLEAIVAKSPLCLPYLLFIDDFGIHRNMYRALKAFYLIPACLDYAERRKLANVFTLSLGPHGANIKEVVGAFRKPIQDLDRGIDLEINGVTNTVWAFAMTFLGDMPQQADNGGFMRHTATMGCRTCFCPKDERANLDFDTTAKGRYHWETTQQREMAEDLDGAELKAFIQDTGIRLEAPSIAKLAPSLDLIQSRAYDAPHSEWRGLGRILQGFLMTTILTKRGSTAYLRAFQQFRFPPGWKRIQSPAYYIWSWSLSEAGKATLLAPLILRSKSTIGWFRLPFLQAAEQVMTIQTTPLQAIIRAFGLIARSNTLVGSQRYTDPSILHQHVLNARRAYQELITCATPAAGGFRNHDDDDENEHDSEDGGGALDEILSAAAHTDSETEGLHMPKPVAATVKGKKKKAKGKGKRKARGNKFEKLLKLPNVHAGLHLADNAREYATVMNSNVLAGELKHKLVCLLDSFPHIAEQY